MDWLEIIIYTTKDGIDSVCGNLYQLGITGVEIEDEAEFQEFLEENRQYWDYVDDELIEQKKKETCVKAYVSDNESGHEMLLLIREAMNALKAFDSENAFGRLEIEVENLVARLMRFFHVQVIVAPCMLPLSRHLHILNRNF